MILEHAILRIKPGEEQNFEAAFPEAITHISASEGFHGLELRPSVERASTYHLIVRWRSLDDHTVGFRESELFAKWRGVIGPFFASPPEVEHFAEPVAAKG
ncbi:antibiotic biosynthesis monooxygenase [Agaricicola taiwanensis]|uniref:Antibiotic biosynthesis monooxygenase n=1 Tax=Agaricicola taiwanensis TaxID=591372 RepID=A0A8J2VKP6_9RHOB|nr:antibiotic biosynthesis monooxygenase [Agaricicola taiwanensis]GGE27077.1 antibiotic biosynthesis monooxygenase [Agaricicola taiwanensis]